MLDIQDMLVRRGSGAQAHSVRLPALQVKAGEILAITGESGCGKSTLLEAIGLLLMPVELPFELRFGAVAFGLGASCCAGWAYAMAPRSV